MKEFSFEHIVSVTHDLMLVSKPELIGFLEYMCGRKLLPLHIPAANHYCALSLAKQFPWAHKIDSTPLENYARALSSRLTSTSQVTQNTDIGFLSEVTKSNLPVYNEYQRQQQNWVERTKKTLRLSDKYEVKTLVESGEKPWSSAAYTYWWMQQRNHED